MEKFKEEIYYLTHILLKNEMKNFEIKSICLGDYIQWDIKHHVEILKKEIGWKGDVVENVPPQYDYEKIECYMQGVRDYIKFIKEDIQEQHI